ncbi:hypothetical protein [Schlesneria paludicola]|uniref:hypothetical protein n=1 Tax=Schlesneria paludicola TaxID=360056 RepID=UPI00029A07B1|nr:hypothetical protein [Schlesneria paludicola]
MANTTYGRANVGAGESVIEWLLDSDAVIRWQVKRDLLDESPNAVAMERSRIEAEGWGCRLLDLQAADGHWGGRSYVCPGWTSTTDSVSLLREWGVDPQGERAQSAIRLVRDRCTWGPQFGNSPFFEGEDEPCINGRVLAAGAYFGQASQRLVERLLSEQLQDGGWNCDPKSQRSSFHSTICVLEGLLEFERASANEVIPAVADARIRAQQYLLERRMFRSLSTGEVIDADWTQISFPTRWHYDILWGLDYLRRAGLKPDQRVAEAIALLEKKQDDAGRWPLENNHAGKVHFELESADNPSRWNTLRALRVLRWYSTCE